MFAPTSGRMARAYVIVRIFYAALLFFACQGFVESIGLGESLRMDPLWPLFWIRWTGQEAGAPLAQLLFVAGPLLAAWRPESRAARWLAFAGCLTGMAYDNSFGKVGHHLHLWTMTSFLFAFLPREREASDSPALGEAALRIFWGAQAALLLTYTLSGIAKVLGAAVQIARGDAYTLFSSSALARHVAERLLMTGEHSLLGNLIVGHPQWGGPALLGAVYLETFALAAACRPSLHRVWGLGLILMHLGIFLSMNVTFSHSILLLGLLLLASPFAMRDGKSPSLRAPFTWRRRLRDIPLFGRLATTLLDMFTQAPRDSLTWVFYEGDCGICSRWVAFLLARGLPDEVRFARLGGKKHAEFLARHSALVDADSVVVIRVESGPDGEETVRLRSEAMFWLMPRLRGPARLLVVANLVPRCLADFGYRTVSRFRHRRGRDQACALFPESERWRFAEDG
jgi:predicted DCC family thiol-disulfide oxidoreductase YuxK